MVSRRSIANIEIDDDGTAFWNPSPRYVALGFSRKELGKPANLVPFVEMGKDPNDFFFYPVDCPVKLQIMKLNAAARSVRRADKIARKLAKQIVDTRSPDR